MAVVVWLGCACPPKSWSRSRVLRWLQFGDSEWCGVLVPPTLLWVLFVARLQLQTATGSHRRLQVMCIFVCSACGASTCSQERDHLGEEGGVRAEGQGTRHRHGMQVHDYI